MSHNEKTSDGDDSYEHDDHDLRGFCFCKTKCFWTIKRGCV